jgi:ornithine carbamoyltransferase
MQKATITPFLQLGSNHFLLGDTIVSYETEVAKIRDGKIQPNGKYSRTTTKHLHSAAWLLGLEIDRAAPKQQAFYELPYGTKTRRSEAITIGASRAILDTWRIVQDFDLAYALNWTSLNSMDRHRALEACEDEASFMLRVEQVQKLKSLGLA